MARRKNRRRTEEREYNTPKGGWFKALIDAFLLNIFRLCKSAIYLEIDSIGHFIFDVICLGLPLVIMYFLKWWYGYYAIFGLIGVCLTAGISVRLGQRAKEKKQLKAMEFSTKENESVPSITPQSFKANEPIMPPQTNKNIGNIETRMLKPNELPDYDESDLEHWNQWFKTNRGASIRAGR